MIKRLIQRVLRKYRNGITNALGLDETRDDYLRYLCSEVSELRSIVRYLAADKIHELPHVTQTYESFDSQWGKLLDSQCLLSNNDFRDSITETICSYSELDPIWFKGKRILDAGCGSGRFTYGFAKLGASVVAVDQSTAGLAEARKASEGLNADVTFVQHNLLEPLPFEAEFDLVWSYGVLHHTGDTYRGFSNISSLVKPGGQIFLMLYGEPDWNRPIDFYSHAEYSRLRHLARNRTFEEKLEIIRREKPDQDLHGWFDAVSPMINDCYRFDEIEGWLIQSGFKGTHRTNDLSNFYIIAERSNAPD